MLTTILLTITDLALTTTPLIILVVMMMMIMRMMMRVQKVALKSLKIEYVVAWGISLDILVHQIFLKKSYGFTAI